jgi:hypothetical protein
MKKIRITIMLSVLLVLISRQPLCADEREPVEDHLKIPLISSSSRVLFREDFRRITEIIAKTDDMSVHEVARLAMPYSDKNALVLWNLSYGIFFPLADWLYLPLYGGLTAGYAHGAAAFSNTSLLLGSGFLLDFEYLALGMSVDASYDSDSNYALVSDFPKYLKPGFGLYPVLNTGKFPFLRYLEKIAGEFSVSERKTESPDAMFENLAWASKLVFNYLFKIPVFDLYVKSGKNDFFPEYDLSENYTGFKSLTYGGIIGTKTLSVEVNYTMITGAVLRGKDSVITDSQKKILHYPFGLNGFPSLTLHWHPDFLKSSYWYLRLSTAQGMFLLSEDDIKKYPVIPTLGLALPTFEFFGGRKSVLLGSFSMPFVATVALEMYL